MLEYKVDNHTYGFSYKELKEEYFKHIEMSDKKFMENLPSALHLACFICFIKEVPTYICLSDKGIIHELTHLLQHGQTDAVINLKDIRKLFKKQLKLA